MSNRTLQIICVLKIISCELLTAERNEVCPDEDLGLECKDQCSQELVKCADQCDTSDCLSKCNREHLDCEEECPCEQNCPNGCSSCANTICKSILVLNNYPSYDHEPVMIKSGGGKLTNFQFSMGNDTYVYSSCSVSLNGEYYVFGGVRTYKNQISIIKDCGLERVGDLPFDFNEGACGTYNFPEERALLCFHAFDTKTCHSYDGDKFETHSKSIYSHNPTTLGNIENQAVAVGGGTNTQVEIFNITSNTWATKSQFPYCGRSLWYIGLVNLNDSIMVLGGQCDAASLSTQIAKYKIDQWSYVGNLLRTRSSHRAILIGQQIHVVGGYNLREFQKTEIITLDEKNEIMEIIETEPRLVYYQGYPELFLVDAKFCIKN